MRLREPLTSIVMSLLIVLVAARPGPARAAPCPQLEPLLSITGVSNGTLNSVDQATLNVGGCATLRLVVVSQPGSVVTDVTNNPNTHFFTAPSHGTFSPKNQFCVGAPDCGLQFPIYAVYHDPCTGTDLTATAHITVAHCTTACSLKLEQCVTYQQIFLALVDQEGFKQELLSLINNYRGSHGLGALQRVEILEGAAQAHSQDMQNYNSLSHNLPPGTTFQQRLLTNVGYQAKQVPFPGHPGQTVPCIGEDIANGISAEAVFRGWLGSAEHLQDIVNPNFTQIGLGLVDGCTGTNFLLWWTIDLGCSDTAYPQVQPGPTVDRSAAAAELVSDLNAADAAYCAGNFTAFQTYFDMFVDRWAQLGLLDDCSLTQSVYNCLISVLHGAVLPTGVSSPSGFLFNRWFNR